MTRNATCTFVSASLRRGLATILAVLLAGSVLNASASTLPLTPNNVTMPLMVNGSETWTGNSALTNTFTIRVGNADYIVVGGGGGGGGSTANNAGGAGGGGGGVTTGSFDVTAGSYTMTVSGAVGGGTNGGSSVIVGVSATASGGLAGGGGVSGNAGDGGQSGLPSDLGAGTRHTGGNGPNTLAVDGGGGGAGYAGNGAGGSNSSGANANGGGGGSGGTFTLNGWNAGTYGGGGGGARVAGGTAGAGGAGGGGGGGRAQAGSNLNGGNGGDNTGGGGGGGGNNTGGGAGGSGVIRLHYYGAAGGTGGSEIAISGTTGENQRAFTGSTTWTPATAAASQIAIFSGDLSGTGILSVNTGGGLGTLVLSGSNSYTTTTISAGTLQIGNAGTTGTLGSGTVTNSGALVFNRTNSYTVSNTINGTGTLTHAGAGTTSLTGTNLYNGATTINAGTLVVGVGGAGSIANSAVTINNGGTLMGSGTTGEVTINSGGTLSPGNSPGTLNTGNSIYAGGGSYVWEINNTSAAQGFDPGWDWQNITGSLNITANSGNKFNIDITGLNNSNAPGTVSSFNLSLPYSWVIASASGGITGFDPAAFTLNTANFTNNNPIGSGTFSLDVSGNNLMLYYSGATAALRYWDIDGATAGAGGATPSGTWSTADANWSSSSAGTAATQNWSSGDDAVFVAGSDATGAYTVTIAPAGIIGRNLTVKDGAPTIAGGTLTLTGTTPTLTVNASRTLSIDSIVAGSDGVTKAGVGMLTLAGANTYTGTTTLGGGIVNVASAESPGTSGPLGNSPAANPGSIVLSGSTLQYSTANQFDYSGRFSTAASQQYNVDTNGQDVTWATALTSNGGTLTKSGTGTLALTAPNTYTGTNTLSGGTVNLGVAENAGVSGPLGQSAASNPGNVVLSGGKLQYSAANQFDYSGRFSTAAGQQYQVDTNGQNVQWATALTSAGGTLTKSGTGTLTLSGANTYSGPTNIDGGALQIGNGGTSGTLGGGVVTNNASLVFNRSNNHTVANAIGGTGTLTHAGTGTTSLTGTNLYNGATVVNAGTLVVGVSGVGSIANSAVTVNSGGTLQGSGTTGAVTVNSGGSINPGDSPGTLNTGSVNWNGGVYNWEVNSVTVAGGLQDSLKGTSPGHDWLNINGNLSISSPSTLNVRGLNTSNVPGTVSNFDPYVNYQWKIATTTGSISGTASSLVTLNTANFTNNNNIGDGSFAVSQDANNVYLNYSAANHTLPGTLPGNMATLNDASGSVTFVGNTTLSGTSNVYVGSVEYLVVGGGGGGEKAYNASTNAGGGGGGGGRVLTGFGDAASSTIGVTVGGGGQGATQAANASKNAGNGGSSSLAGIITAAGGSANNSFDNNSGGAGNNSGGAGSTGGGGGGGAGGTGGSGNGGNGGGGGVGQAFPNITGTSVRYGAGGGGGIVGAPATSGRGFGGGDGGGDGGHVTNSGSLLWAPTGGAANSGGGGGGGARNNSGNVNGAAGGSGVVFVHWYGDRDAATGGTAGTLDATTGNYNMRFNGSGALGIASPATLTTQVTYFPGVLSGSGNLRKGGPGTLVLSGANNYTGTTFITGGYLQPAVADALGSGALGNGGLITFEGGTLQYTATSASANYDARFKNSTGPMSVDTNGLSINWASALDSTNVGGLQKVGSGTLTLGGTTANTFIGTTFVLGGELILNKTAGVNAIASDNLFVGTGLAPATLRQLASNQIPDTTDVTLFNQGVWRLGGNNEQINNLLDDGSGGAVVDGYGGSPTVMIGAGDFAGTIQNSSGTLALTKTSSGNLFLRGNNTYTGNTTVNQGILALANSGNNNNIATSPVIRIQAGAQLNTAGLAGATDLVLAAGQTLTGSGRVTGGLTVGSGSFLAPGNSPGTLLNSGSTTFAGGGTYVWEINDATGVQGADPGWDWESITSQLRITATSGNKFNVDITGLNLSNVLGAVDHFNKYTNYTWNIATAGAGITGFSASAFNLLTNNFTNNNSISGTGHDGVFGIQTSGNQLQLIYTGAVDAAPGSFFWKGDVNGFWNANSAGNTNWATSNSGATDTGNIPSAINDVFFTVDSGAANYSTTLGLDFSIKSLTIKGTGTGVASNPVTIGGTHTLTIGGGGMYVAPGGMPVTISSKLAFGAGFPGWQTDSENLLTISGNISNGAITLNSYGSGDVLVSGVLGSGSGGLSMYGTGTLTLSGANTYTGVNTLSGGIVRLGIAENPGVFGPMGQSPAANPGNIVLAGSTLQYTASNQFDYSGRFDTSAGQQYKVDTNGQSVTWATSLSSSSGTLTKLGAGTLTLTNNNAYSGDTLISAGTLALLHGSNNNIAGSPLIDVNYGAVLDVSGLAGTTDLVLASGQTLAGNGTVFGNVTVSAGALVSPGSSPGTLLHDGTENWNGGGGYLWQINDVSGTPGGDPGWDLISISGALSITASTSNRFIITISGDDANFNDTLDYTWLIAAADGGIAWDFTGALNDHFLLVDNFATPHTGMFSVSQLGGTLNILYTAAEEVDPSPVPEPSTWLLAGAGMVALALLCRRSRAFREDFKSRDLPSA